MAFPRALEIELETVGPMWTGGADLQAELRAPSLRGALRNWLRALLGGTLGEALPALRAAETAVFGNTSQGSSLIVRMRGRPQIGDALGERAALPGLAYALWTIIHQKRTGILAGERFRVRFQDRPFPFPPVQVEGRLL